MNTEESWDFLCGIQKEMDQYLDERQDIEMHVKIEPLINEKIDEIYLDMDSRISEVKNEMAFEMYKMKQELEEQFNLKSTKSFWKWWK